MGSRLLTYHNILKFDSDKKPASESCPCPCTYSYPRYNLLPYINSKMWSLFSFDQQSGNSGSSSSSSPTPELNCNDYTKTHLHLLLARFQQLEVNCKETDRFSSSWSLNRGHRMYLYQVTQSPPIPSTTHASISNHPRFKNSPVDT